MKAGPTFVLGLFSSNVNEGHLNLAFVIAQDLAIGAFLVSIFKSSISVASKQLISSWQAQTKS